MLKDLELSSKIQDIRLNRYTQIDKWKAFLANAIGNVIACFMPSAL